MKLGRNVFERSAGREDIEEINPDQMDFPAPHRVCRSKNLADVKVGFKAIQDNNEIMSPWLCILRIQVAMFCEKTLVKSLAPQLILLEGELITGNIKIEKARFERVCGKRAKRVLGHASPQKELNSDECYEAPTSE